MINNTKAVIVRLECITNMHVGNGDVNYNIIDNEIERDAVTGYPTINSSGVKGALREYFVKRKVDDNYINAIFGKESAGKLRFLAADMLAIPARASAGNSSYYLVSTEEAIETYINKLEMFLNISQEIREENSKEYRAVEGKNIKKYKELLYIDEKKKKEIHILEDKEFRNISLPVLARNKLENGTSVNLWYEEVVPHKSLFYFIVIAESVDEQYLSKFKEIVDDQIIQFGGNASIGYGLCKVKVEG
ncbi:MAG: type III-B CRISPR module RAMP protein Cmr4 [Lachnospiraceae bacterium]|nr:type III-B CRISPR module RAMP protein Cmr4 [Lachnospiraceae bacterium]